MEELLERRGQSINGLSKASGLSRPTIQHLLRGQGDVFLSTLDILAEHLEVNVERVVAAVKASRRYA
jgi:transcriptional regulator with XRE-family HTH domain